MNTLIMNEDDVLGVSEDCVGCGDDLKGRRIDGDCGCGELVRVSLGVPEFAICDVTWRERLKRSLWLVLLLPIVWMIGNLGFSLSWYLGDGPSGPPSTSPMVEIFYLLIVGAIAFYVYRFCLHSTQSESVLGQKRDRHWRQILIWASGIFTVVSFLLMFFLSSDSVKDSGGF